MLRAKFVALLSVFLLLAGIPAWPQVTIIVNKVPAYTPLTDTLYMATSLNNWEPGNKNYMFTRQKDGTFILSLPNESRPFQFKITRGSWPSVEGDIHGGKIGDHGLTGFQKMPHTEIVQVVSWEDLAKTQSWDIVVQHMPANTPPDAQIYISGNFNNWKETDPNYRLIKFDDGSYAIKIQKTNTDTLVYKFNRGSWKAAECRDNGRLLHNRATVWDNGVSNVSINTEILAWQDLQGGKNLFLAIVLIMATCQGLILIAVLLSNKNRNLQNSIALAGLLFLTGLALFARLAVYNYDFFLLQPKLYVLSDFIYVLYGPAVWFLTRSVMGISSNKTGVLIFFSGVLVITVAVFLPVVVVPEEDFTMGILTGRYDTFFHTCSALASAYNIIIFVLCARLLGTDGGSSLREERYRKAKAYAQATLAWSGFVMLLWLFADIVFGVSAWFHYEAWSVLESIVDLLWIFLAAGIYFQGYLYLRSPHIFFEPRVEAGPEINAQTHHKEDLQELKQQLDALMQKAKPYLNPKLTLEDLAESMHINLHTLSWLINDGYGKNFFDFVNEYRIEEFIRLSRNEKFKNYTFLAVAFEAGFNSKTTFNRVFKKHTGKTPREYLGLPYEMQPDEM
ncbi:MAG: AraC family transcriptional regulator [Bacteroidota bacterium]